MAARYDARCDPRGVTVDWKNPKSVETKITRLTKELGQFDKFFYGFNEEKDRASYASMLERKRDDVVRSAVLQVHTAIEDLMNLYIIGVVLGTTPQKRSRKLSTIRGKALRKMLYGKGSLGFDMKMSFAVALGFLSAEAAKKLAELNMIRNKCSHNWLLKTPRRRNRRPRQKKPPLLLYEGRDLHSINALKDFIGEFGAFYGKLFASYAEHYT